MIRFEYLDRWYTVDPLTFSGGELHLGLQERTNLWRAREVPVIRVATRLQSATDIMELVLLTELLRREVRAARWDLTIPYLPYARQDRVTDEFTSFSLKAFSKIINSLGYDEVAIYDPHSDVAAALIDNVTVVSQSEIVINRFPALNEHILSTKPCLVAPDSGATKKCNKLAEHYKLPCITAVKVRSTETGEITGTKVSSFDFHEGEVLRFLIVDDICDGGRTFIELAKELRASYSYAYIALYVTHGIFSQKLEKFRGLIDCLYCTDSFIPKNMPLSEDDPPLFIGHITP